MPRDNSPALHLQNVVAFLWDFDKTLSTDYMQAPIFAEYGIEPGTFWGEVGRLVPYYRSQGIRAHKDTVYLNHFQTYLTDGLLPGLTNAKLRELGAKVELCPGMPDFMQRTTDLLASNRRYAEHGITVEHYVISTGFTEMIRGSAVGPYLRDIYAVDFVEDPFRPDSTHSAEALGRISQFVNPMSSVGKTEPIFEISKGVGPVPGLDVNTRMDPKHYRVPIRNMIYIADGPSDTQPFTVVAAKGGLTFGVYVDARNYPGVRQLSDERRVHAIGRADYREGTDTDMWLTSSLLRIADNISDAREAQMKSFRPPATHTSAAPRPVTPQGPSRPAGGGSARPAPAAKVR